MSDRIEAPSLTVAENADTSPGERIDPLTLIRERAENLARIMMPDRGRAIWA